MADNPEYWQQQRFERLTADGHEPFAISHVARPNGGFSYVQGEILADDVAVSELTPEELALIARKPGEQAWLGETLLTQYVFAGTEEDHLRFVAGWRQRTREKNPTSRVDLHYVLTGEKSTVPRGGPAGSPSLTSPHDPPTSWGEGPPVVAVLDTGLDPLSAEAQESNAGNETRVVFEPLLDTDALGAPAQPGGPTVLLSEAGHGTFIVSLIARFGGGDVRIAALRVLDPDGVGSEELLVEGLRRLREDFVTTYGQTVKVVNLSLGGFTDDGGWLDDDDERNDLYPPELRDQVPTGLAAELDKWTGPMHRDTVFVAAAGNDAVKDRPFWPAALAASPKDGHPLVVAVASVRADLLASGFTNRASWVTASTLGEDIVGDYPEGVFPVSPTGALSFDGHGASWSGTSFAAPLVAAEIVRLAQQPAPSLSGRSAWGDLEQAITGNAALDYGLGWIWDPRASGPNLDPTVWP